MSYLQRKRSRLQKTEAEPLNAQRLTAIDERAALLQRVQALLQTRDSDDDSSEEEGGAVAWGGSSTRPGAAKSQSSEADAQTAGPSSAATSQEPRRPLVPQAVAFMADEGEGIEAWDGLGQDGCNLVQFCCYLSRERPVVITEYCYYYYDYCYYYDDYYYRYYYYYYT